VKRLDSVSRKASINASSFSVKQADRRRDCHRTVYQKIDQKMCGKAKVIGVNIPCSTTPQEAALSRPSLHSIAFPVSPEDLRILTAHRGKYIVREGGH
jgi:hypothetical protein